MSLAVRQWVVDHPHAIFRSQSQRDDILDPTRTQTGLIALIVHLLERGHIIEFTAIRADHHDDSNLNPDPPYVGTHAGGYAFDGWPLASPTEGDYLDAQDPRFIAYVRDAQSSPWHFQTGLAGSAYCKCDIAAAGPGLFEDSGGDHVHLSSNG